MPLLKVRIANGLLALSNAPTMRQRVSLPLVLDRQGRVRLLVALMIEAEMRYKLGTDSGVIGHPLFYQSIEIGTDFSRFFVLFNILQGLTGEPNVHCPVHHQHVTPSMAPLDPPVRKDEVHRCLVSMPTNCIIARCRI